MQVAMVVFPDADCFHLSFYGRHSSIVGDDVVEPASSSSSRTSHGILWRHDVVGIPESHGLRFDLLRHTQIDI